MRTRRQSILLHWHHRRRGQPLLSSMQQRHCCRRLRGQHQCSGQLRRRGGRPQRRCPGSLSSRLLGCIWRRPLAAPNVQSPKPPCLTPQPRLLPTRPRCRHWIRLLLLVPSHLWRCQLRRRRGMAQSAPLLRRVCCLGSRCQQQWLCWPATLAEQLRHVLILRHHHLHLLQPVQRQQRAQLATHSTRENALQVWVRGVHLGICGGLAEPLADFVDAAQPKDVECAVVKVLLGLVDDALAVVPPARSVGRLPCRHKLHSQALHARAQRGKK